MTWKTLFFGFDGRISRRQWWLAMLPLLLTDVALSFLVNPQHWLAEIRPGPNLPETLLALAFLIPETAVSVKRFNDRDWPQWMPYGFAVLGVLFNLLHHQRMILVGEELSPFDGVVLSIFVPLSLMALVDNGMLRGTIGPNRHGPDPLDPVQSTAGDGVRQAT